MYLNKWDQSVHKMPEQLIRQRRAETDSMLILSFDKQNKCCTIKAKDGESNYKVTTQSCTCADFQERGLPCKHMYRLNSILERNDSIDRKYQQANSNKPNEKNNKNEKDKLTALLLALFLGYLGLHRFYVGKTFSGLIWLCTFGLFGFGWVVDIYLILTDKFIPKQENSITQQQNNNSTATASDEEIAKSEPKHSADTINKSATTDTDKGSIDKEINEDLPKLDRSIDFGDWVGCNNSPDQLLRFSRAKAAYCTPKSVSYEDKTGIFVGKHGTYSTTLDSCTCLDFSERHLPCKHMFRLAIELGLIRTVYEAYEGSNEPIKELDHIDFGKPEGELGCFLNYQKFKVRGLNDKDKRYMKVYTGIDAEHAIEKAKAAGMHPPFEAEPMEHESPTDRQLGYLSDLVEFIPEGITKDDASCMISRATGEDSIESPSAPMVELAIGLKCEFSAFIGADGLFAEIIWNNVRDRAAIFAYSVRQNLMHAPFGNMLKDLRVSLYYDFADYVLNTPDLIKSLDGRPTYDFQEPSHNTKIYKAAKEYLSNNGVL